MRDDYELRTPFLRELDACIRKRGKALKARGHLELDAGESDEHEWITLRYRHGKSPWIEIDVWDDQAAELRLTSPNRKDRGKKLFVLSGLRLVGNVPLAYRTIEWTLFSAGTYTTHEEITARWRSISVSALSRD